MAMQQTHNNPFFVSAAQVSAELHQAMLTAKQITLTAANARALAQRAGAGAAGFRAITDFIEELATMTVRASDAINKLAIITSRSASNIARAQHTQRQFKVAKQKALNAEFIDSLDKPNQASEQHLLSCKKQLTQAVANLDKQLEELRLELRTATVLAAMSRVEASQAGISYQKQLNIVAENVANAAEKIRTHVLRSQQLIKTIDTERL